VKTLCQYLRRRRREPMKKNNLKKMEPLTAMLTNEIQTCTEKLELPKTSPRVTSLWKSTISERCVLMRLASMLQGSPSPSNRLKASL